MTIFHENSAAARTGLAAAELLTGWREAFSSIFAAISAWHKARRTCNVLRGLSDRTLKDIGLDRSEILSISLGDRTRRQRRHGGD